LNSASGRDVISQQKLLRGMQERGKKNEFLTADPSSKQNLTAKGGPAGKTETWGGKRTNKEKKKQFELRGLLEKKKKTRGCIRER